jgi:hypothetical protein
MKIKRSMMGVFGFHSAKASIVCAFPLSLGPTFNARFHGPGWKNKLLPPLAIEFFKRKSKKPKVNKRNIRADWYGFESGQVYRLSQLINYLQKRLDFKVEFLNTLTEDRVRYEKAPLDHPEILIPHGHEGVQVSVTPHALYPNLAKDEYLLIPAVGATGTEVPLQPFKNYLAP